MTSDQRDVLKKAVANHRNILVIGGTGSGKTTLVNAIINEMVAFDPSERIFIIEDTFVPNRSMASRKARCRPS